MLASTARHSEEPLVPGGIQWHLDKLAAREQQQGDVVPIEKRPYKPPATADGRTRPGMQRRRVSTGLPSSRGFKLSTPNGEAVAKNSDIPRTAPHPPDNGTQWHKSGWVTNRDTHQPQREFEVGSLRPQTSSSATTALHKRTPGFLSVRRQTHEEQRREESSPHGTHSPKSEVETNKSVPKQHANTAHPDSIIAPPESWGSHQPGWLTERGNLKDDDILLPQRPFTTREHRSAQRRTKAMVVYKDIVGLRKVENDPGPMQVAAAAVPCFVDWQGNSCLCAFLCSCVCVWKVNPSICVGFYVRERTCFSTRALARVC
jgi:hypothetical protein